MKCAAEFRTIARNALQGKWIKAVLVGLIAMLLGGIGAEGPEVKFTLNDAGAHANLEIAGKTIYSTACGIDPGLQSILVGSIIYIAVIAIVLGVVYFILGSVVSVGYSRFNLNLVDGEDPAFETLFSSISIWKTAAISNLLRGLYVVLWSLLLIIPGIVASYSYSMTDFILADHPELTASEAIARSKEMMRGNKWRLFCLNFSFIGWGILCLFTLGIGNLWLTPYKNASNAAFYREISGTEVL